MIPGAHILPCPYCSVPLDASDPDNYCYYDEHEDDNVMVASISIPSCLGMNLECHNCHRETFVGTVLLLLEAKDGHERIIVQQSGGDRERPWALAVGFNEKNDEYKPTSN
jgi:hypothetical protein